MRSFEHDRLQAQPVSQALLQAVRAAGEYRGRETLFAAQSPQALEAIREAAVIESTESSNRIEGVTAPAARVRELVAGRTAPRNRSEQEIAGYRDVLQTIHANHPHMKLTPGLVLQLHRDLYAFQRGRGGKWKTTDNQITETLPDGRRRVRFTPVPAHATAAAMQRLHAEFDRDLAAGRVEPLLLVAAYVLDFLCIHPFLDGNGRIARLLSLLLLYQQGYGVGRYISLERIVEATRDSYYDTLFRSSQQWHEGQHDLLPWCEFFIGVMLVGAYQEFEARVGVLTRAPGAKSELVRDAIRRLPPTFRYADLERACPGVSRPTVQRVLAELRRQQRIRCSKPGRNAVWEKLE